MDRRMLAPILWLSSNPISAQWKHSRKLSFSTSMSHYAAYLLWVRWKGLMIELTLRLQDFQQMCRFDFSMMHWTFTVVSSTFWAFRSTISHQNAIKGLDPERRLMRKKCSRHEDVRCDNVALQGAFKNATRIGSTSSGAQEKTAARFERMTVHWRRREESALRISFGTFFATGHNVRASLLFRPILHLSLTTLYREK